ncbi:MAG: hypothetical protein LBP55_07535, partial [Candidatus Adiutrix sp.]|nr:hypothetical protein [Candidatus Adiutrix sp.]
MEAAEAIFTLFILFCLAMAFASLITPKTAWFLKNKTKKNGQILWFCLFLVCLFIGPKFFPNPLLKAT